MSTTHTQSCIDACTGFLTDIHTDDRLFMFFVVLFDMVQLKIAKHDPRAFSVPTDSFYTMLYDVYTALYKMLRPDQVAVIYDDTHTYLLDFCDPETKQYYLDRLTITRLAFEKIKRTSATIDVV